MYCFLFVILIATIRNIYGDDCMIATTGKGWVFSIDAITGQRSNSLIPVNSNNVFNGIAVDKRTYKYYGCTYNTKQLVELNPCDNSYNSIATLPTRCTCSDFNYNDNNIYYVDTAGQIIQVNMDTFVSTIYGDFGPRSQTMLFSHDGTKLYVFPNGNIFYQVTNFDNFNPSTLIPVKTISNGGGQYQAITWADPVIEDKVLGHKYGDDIIWIIDLITGLETPYLTITPSGGNNWESGIEMLWGFSCDDIPCDYTQDDCEDDSDCTVDNSVCNNNNECVCDAGYIESNGFCVDINECLNPDVCGDNSYCINTDGSYICACNAGYKDFDLATPGIICQDIDECALDVDNDCAINNNAVCENTEGSFVCKCLSGFEGDATVGCTDINECANDNDNNCATNNGAQCINQYGSYMCECLPGFIGNPNEECEDIRCITSCEGKADGNYASCESCNKFVMCSNEYIYQYDCAGASPPLVYDQLLGYCVWPWQSQTCEISMMGSGVPAKTVSNAVDIGVGSNINTLKKDNPIFGYITVTGIILFVLLNNIFIGLWCIYKRNNKNNAYYKANIVIDSDNESNEINV
eukprot:98420_1